ncbi:carbamoyltransferase HypF [Pseudonocardia alni]|uniref:carbamoyltransferase HypF n=1 Tax=Pseudonocardia alni TaxID=33907 RepID=UPI0036983B4A
MSIRRVDSGNGSGPVPDEPVADAGATTATVRHRVTVTGVVQGVGFRPFVHRVATGLGLAGHVGNDASGVFVEVQGPAAAVAEFARRLRDDAPPLARVDDLRADELPTTAEQGFRIVSSRDAAGAAAPIPPDIAVCDDCLAELFDPADRRYRHPFVTCTNCGPRFTIIRELPYDRPGTTMAGFPLCARCDAEYHDPGDRRFHAQPVACPDCGPELRFEGGPAPVVADAALAAAQRALAEGKVVGIKGIGGYHLACRADDETAVAALRARKSRGGKPFAVLVRDLAAATRLAEIDDDEAAVLTSPARPVVLLRRRPGTAVARGVAPGNPMLGLLLPYSPVHHLLLAPVPGTSAPVPEAIVLTSANRSDEPICHTDDDAATRLPALADVVLTHDRPIHVPCDDSVVRVVDGHELPIRRSRGYAPLPVELGVDGPAVLAVGGELKNTFCLTDGRRAYLSAHVGDMGTLETLQAYERSVRQLSEIRGRPERLAADLHPGYLTRGWAERNAGERELDLVQHHHAHVVSLLAEHQRLGEPIVGVAFDGTGYGGSDDDSAGGGAAVWGGEILRLDRHSHRFVRAGHLAEVPLPGGDAAVRNPRRMALSHLLAAGVAWDDDLPPVAACDEAERRLLDSQLRSGVGCARCTSVGRLFDAVASLLGVRHAVDYEGQAAIELETLAADAPPGPGFETRIEVGADGVLDLAPLVRDLVTGVRERVDRGVLAAAFHTALAEAVTRVVVQVAGTTRLAGLTGGVFQNVMLSRLCVNLLQGEGFEVLTHRLVPPNDGGLALGQVAVSMLKARDAARGHPSAGAWNGAHDVDEEV